MPEWDSVKTTALIRVARLRVPVGFIVGIMTIAMARPTYVTLVIGAPIVVVGEALRIWAAGHLEKKREVTNSGPYRCCVTHFTLVRQFLELDLLLQREQCSSQPSWSAILG